MATGHGATIAATPRPSPLRPTLLERTVAAAPLPYAATAVLIALFFGPPGYLLFRYLDTGSWPASLAIYFHGEVPAGGVRLAGRLAIWSLQLFYLLLVARRVRLAIAAAEPAVAAMLRGGAVQYHNLIAAVAHHLPPLLIAAVLALAFSPLIVADWRDAAGPPARAYLAVRSAWVYFTYGTLLWVYGRSLWGLWLMGRQPLRLKPLVEDVRLGAGALGDLSLALALALVGFVLLGVPVLFLMPVYWQYTVVLAGMSALGVVLFFLPLRAVHGQMAAARGLVHARLRGRLLRATGVADRAADPPAIGSLATPAPGDVAGLAELFAVQAALREVEATPTWPFDTAVVARLGAAAGAIIIAIITDALVRLLLGS